MRSFALRHAVVLLLVALALAAAAMLGVALARAEEPAGQPTQAPTVVGELMQKRTSTSKTWLLSNGMYRNEIFLGPIHFKDEAGAWQDINTTLTPDGVYSEYKSAATPVGVTIRDESPGNRPVRLELDGYVVDINMANSLEDTKIVQGNSARFFGVAHDADLKYEVLDDGVKETILLYSAEAPTSYSFSISHPGLSLAKDTE